MSEKLEWQAVLPPPVPGEYSSRWVVTSPPKVVSAFTLPNTLEFKGRPACMTDDGQMWVMADGKWVALGAKVGE